MRCTWEDTAEKTPLALLRRQTLDEASLWWNVNVQIAFCLIRHTLSSSQRHCLPPKNLHRALNATSKLLVATFGCYILLLLADIFSVQTSVGGELPVLLSRRVTASPWDRGIHTFGFTVLLRSLPVGTWRIATSCLASRIECGRAFVLKTRKVSTERYRLKGIDWKVSTEKYQPRNIE